MFKVMYRQMFSEAISVDKIAWKPLDVEFMEANTITVTDRDSFGFSNSEADIRDAFSTFVVSEDCCRLLRIA